MNIVSENYADRISGPDGRSRNGLIAAIIGEGLRDNLPDQRDDVPEALLALLRTMDRRMQDRSAMV